MFNGFLFLLINHLHKNTTGCVTLKNTSCDFLIFLDLKNTWQVLLLLIRTAEVQTIWRGLFYHQLDAQTSCLFTYNTLIKIVYMFRAYPAHLQKVHFVTVYMRSLVSSSSAGDCLVHRLRKRPHIYNYEVDLLKMNRVCSKHVQDFN
jgi:hypothetical protein